MKKGLVSFLITHYNRYESLLTCLNSIRANFHRDYEIVVSDDFSTKVIQDELIKNSLIDKLCLASKNEGLTSNINKGIKSCTGEFIVYVQDDFSINSSLNDYWDEILRMINCGNADMVRITTPFRFNSLRKNEQSPLLIIPRFSLKDPNIHWRYGDHPYVVRNDFYEKFGYYLQNVSTLYGEVEYAIRLLKLNPNIYLTPEPCASENQNIQSVRDELMNQSLFYSNYFNTVFFLKILRRFFQKMRFEFEVVFYNKLNRRLITYKNYR